MGFTGGARCGGGDLKGSRNFEHPNAASPAGCQQCITGLGGKGRGWGHRAPFVPDCSSPPEALPREIGGHSNSPLRGKSSTVKTPATSAKKRVCKFGSQCWYKSLFCPFDHGQDKEEQRTRGRLCWFGEECKFKFCPFEHLGKRNWEPHQESSQAKEDKKVKDKTCGLQWVKVAGVQRTLQSPLSSGYGMQGQPPLNSASRGGHTSPNYWSTLAGNKKKSQEKSEGQGRESAPGQMKGSRSATEREPLPRNLRLFAYMTKFEAYKDPH